MSATEIWRDFDPNLDLPEELKNARFRNLPDVEDESGDQDSDIDYQSETFDDDGSALDSEDGGDFLDVPDGFTVVSQTVRTAPDGTQVVDVVLDVNPVQNAINYEVRISTG